MDAELEILGLVDLSGVCRSEPFTVEELTEMLSSGDEDTRCDAAYSANATPELFMRAAQDESYWVLYCLINNPHAPLDAVLEAGKRIRIGSRGFTIFLRRISKSPEFAGYPEEWLVEAFS